MPNEFYCKSHGLRRGNEYDENHRCVLCGEALQLIYVPPVPIRVQELHFVVDDEPPEEN